jgi:uncharacterized membrane protein
MDTPKQKSIINILYLLLVLSTILSFVPLAAAQMVSLVMVAATLIAAYACRAKDTEDGLLYNHMTYMIGTIWIGSAFILLGMVLAGTWVYLQGDHSLLESVASGQILDEAGMNQLMMDYAHANKELLVTATLATVGPAVLYFVYRVANGYSRAAKGYRIAKPKSWL